MGKTMTASVQVDQHQCGLCEPEELRAGVRVWLMLHERGVAPEDLCIWGEGVKVSGLWLVTEGLAAGEYAVFGPADHGPYGEMEYKGGLPDDVVAMAGWRHWSLPGG